MRSIKRKLPGMVAVDIALRQYEAHLRAKGNRESNISTTLIRLRTWLGDFASLADATAKRMAEVYRRRQEVVAADTHRNELAQVQTFFAWARRQHMVRESPVQDIEPQGKRSHGKEQLRKSEAAKLREVCIRHAEYGDMRGLAVLLALEAGLRSGEILGLVKRDVDTTDGITWVWVDRGKTDAARRRVQVEGEFAELLVESAHLAGGHLFPSASASAGHMEAKWLRQAVAALCREAGVPVVSPHGLRGTAATLAYDAGVAGVEVARTLGHRSERTTQRHYAKGEAVQAAGMRRRLKVIGGTK